MKALIISLQSRDSNDLDKSFKKVEAGRNCPWLQRRWNQRKAVTREQYCVSWDYSSRFGAPASGLGWDLVKDGLTVCLEAGVRGDWVTLTVQAGRAGLAGQGGEEIVLTFFFFNF